MNNKIVLYFSRFTTRITRFQENVWWCEDVVGGRWSVEFPNLAGVTGAELFSRIIYCRTSRTDDVGHHFASEYDEL